MISNTDLQEWKNKYNNEPNNKLLENVISNNSLSKIQGVRSENQNYNPIYNYKVTPELKVTNQNQVVDAGFSQLLM